MKLTPTNNKVFVKLLTEDEMGKSDFVKSKQFKGQYKYEHYNAIQCGIVYSAPVSVNGQFQLEKGDKVYTHHFIQEEDNTYQFFDEYSVDHVQAVVNNNGTTVSAIEYSLIYCVIRDGKVTMLNDKNLIQPLEKPMLVNGEIIVEMAANVNDSLGTMFSASPLFKDTISEGQTVTMLYPKGVRKESKHYYIEFEGKILILLEDDYVAGIVTNNDKIEVL